MNCAMDEEFLKEEKIPPRTKKERSAYVQGYCNALYDVSESGWDTAIKWAKDMIDFDKRLRET